MAEAPERLRLPGRIGRSLRRTLRPLLGLRPAPLQVGALCLRERDGNREVLLVTSRDTGRWVIPKGWPMRGKSLAEAALAEAWEEAGVRATAPAKLIGHYFYSKRRSGYAMKVEVRLFLIKAERILSDFPEKSERQRTWVSPAKAAELVSERDLSAVLERL